MDFECGHTTVSTKEISKYVTRYGTAKCPRCAGWPSHDCNEVTGRWKPEPPRRSLDDLLKEHGWKA